MMDMDLKITYVSPSIKHMLGWDSDEYLKHELKEMMKQGSLTKVFDEYNV